MADRLDENNPPDQSGTLEDARSASVPPASGNTKDSGTSGMLKATAAAFVFGLPLSKLGTPAAQAQTAQPAASPTPGDPGDSADAALCDSDPVDNPDVTNDPGQPDNGIPTGDVTTDQTDNGPVGDGGPGPGGPGGPGDYGYY